MDNDNLMALKYPIRVGVREGRKPEYSEKTIEAHERSTAETLSHEMSHARLDFSGEKHANRLHRLSFQK